MKRKLSSVIVLLALFFVLTPALTTNAHAASVQAGSSLPTLSALENTCSKIDVHLNGTQPPTITCAQAKGVSTTPPLTKTMPCSEYNYQNDLDVVYIRPDGNHDDVCFTGRGYLAYRINKVYQIFSDAHVNSWFLWYVHGSSQGAFYNLNTYDNWQADFFGTQADITQINLGAQHA